MVVVRAGKPSLRRLTRTLALTVRHLGPLAVPLARGQIDRTRLGSALAAAFAEIGATFVKLGQLVASAPGLVGEDFAGAFRSLLDQGAAVPFPEVIATIERDLGCPVDEVFAEIEREPIGAASLAIVHRAQLTDGRAVAIKVLRPGIEEVLAEDLSLLRPIAAELAAVVRTSEARIAEELVEGLGHQLEEELDLRREAAAMVEFRDLLDDVGETGVVVPEPVIELTGRRVLTMELLEGVAVDDPLAIAEAGGDVSGPVAALVRAWFVGALRSGVFHGDVHAGNLLLLRDGRIGMLDWGIVGRLDDTTQTMLRSVVAGALGDEAAWEPAAGIMLGRLFTAEELAVHSITPIDAAPVLRARVRGLLTEPLGSLRLAELLDGPPVPIEPEEVPPLRVMAARFMARRLRRRRTGTGRRPQGNGSDDGRDQATPAPTFDRSMFLLVKQLVYFERYGAQHLPDQPLLSDEATMRWAIGAELRSTGELL